LEKVDEQSWDEAADKTQTWNETEHYDIAVEQPEAEENAHVGFLELAAAERAINSFKIASGLVMPDEGPVGWKGYTEACVPCSLQGRLAEVHKPLVSASKLAQKVRLCVLYGDGGAIADANSQLGQEAIKVLQDGLWWNPTELQLEVCLANGVHSFNLRDDGGKRHRFNYDIGAAETVMPQFLASVSLVPVDQPMGGPAAGDEAVRPERLVLADEPDGRTRAQGQAGQRTASEGLDLDIVQEEEVQAPTIIQTPRAPNASEQEEHELLGDTQYRSWCRNCVAARVLWTGAHHRWRRSCRQRDPRGGQGLLLHVG
jgi:hypothetical protein